MSKKQIVPLVYRPLQLNAEGILFSSLKVYKPLYWLNDTAVQLAVLNELRVRLMGDIYDQIALEVNTGADIDTKLLLDA